MQLVKCKEKAKLYLAMITVFHELYINKDEVWNRIENIFDTLADILWANAFLCCFFFFFFNPKVK